MLVSELIEETRRILFSGQREERNKLTDDIVPEDTSLTVTYDVGSITRGTKLSIDFEDIYVWDKSSQVIGPVDRGQFGSTSAYHYAGAIIHVNPKFSNNEIYNAINDELSSLSTPANGVYIPYSYEFDYNPTIEGYAISDSIIDVIDVRYRLPGAAKAWEYSTDWDIEKLSSTTDFPGGVSLRLRDAYPGQPVIIRVKFAFPTLTKAMTWDTSFQIIPDNILDILTIGAAWRLVSSREVRRNFDEVQGDTRRAGEVPPGANLGAARELGRIRQQRINEEASRLSQLYPQRSRRYPFIVGGW